VRLDSPAAPGKYAAARNWGVGAYVPLGWGRYWRAARARSAQSPAVVAVLGDSVSRGYNVAGGTFAGAWAGQLKAALQAAYGNGGSGFKGACDSLAFTAAMAGYVAEQVTFTGAWTWAFSVLEGPGSIVFYTSTNADTVVFPGVVGTTVRLFLLSSASGATYTYKVDGGAAVPDTTVGASGVKVVTINTGTPGPHTITLTHTGASGTTFLNVCGVSGDNASGVRVDNFSASGGTSSYLGATAAPTYGHAADWSGGPSNPADLVIYSFGVNDVNPANNVAADTYLANVQTFFSHIRSGAAGGKRGQVDGIIQINHLGTWGPNALYSAYSSRLLGLAEAYGLAVVDHWSRGQNSWEYWRDLGYWSDGTTGGAAGNDAVHPRREGFTAMAAPIIELLSASTA
jgi:lysophospholipase L1-like esterase